MVQLLYNIFLSLLYTVIKKMNISPVLSLIAALGFVLNRKNIILVLISMYIILLDVTLGQIYAIYIIAIAGIESAIGLGILVAFYRLRGITEIGFECLTH